MSGIKTPDFIVGLKDGISNFVPHVSTELIRSYPVTSAVVTAGVSYASVWLLCNSSRKRALRRKYAQIQKRKQEERKKQFDSLRSKYRLDDESQHLDFLNLTWDELVDKLQRRELTAVNVLKAFIAQALEVTSFCNAVTEFNPRAMEIAEELDALPEVKGPLHGIPFAVKDDTNLCGMDTTLGVAKNCFKPLEKSAVLVQVLEECGAIPFCKTNVPQTLLTLGSDNPVFGQTTNVMDKKLCPGGSSSGSGALVGGFGAFFATGTDLGGSVRIPAFFNGVSALKATYGRTSDVGIECVLDNLLGMKVTNGIIGWNSKVVSAVFKAILEKNEVQAKMDATVVPCPWNDEIYSSKKKLRIGYFTKSDFFPPLGDTEETVKKAVKLLEGRGHTLVPMNIPCPSRYLEIAAKFIFSDENINVIKLLDGEEVADCIKLNASLIHWPAFLVKFLRFLMQRKSLRGLYSPTLASILGVGAETSLEMWENQGALMKLKSEVLEEWSRLSLDCCICPVMPFPAISKDVIGHVAVSSLYTFLWNVTDFPAGVVKRIGVESGKNFSKFDHRGDVTLMRAKEACKSSVGLPIGVQVVGLPYKEEIVLRVMEELEQANDDSS